MKKRNALCAAGVVLYAIAFSAMLELGWRTSYIWSFVDENASAWSALRFALSKDTGMVCIGLALGLILAGALYLLFLRVRVWWTIRLRRKTVSIGAAPLVLVLVIAVTAVVAAGAYRENSRYQAERDHTLKLRRMLASEKKIIHACGEITGPDGEVYDYTNSREALEQTLSKGAHFVEIDFAFTSDKKLVCIHNWKKDFVKADGTMVESAATWEEFTKGSILGFFSTMTLEDLVQILQDHPDVYIVMDVKAAEMLRGYRYMAKFLSGKYPEMLPRMIPQFYHASQYEYLYGCGYRTMIFSLYRSGVWEYSYSALDGIIKRKLLLGVTFRQRYLHGGREGEQVPDDLLQRVLSSRNPVYVHTIDDPDDQQEAYGMGVTAVYTNQAGGK